MAYARGAGQAGRQEASARTGAVDPRGQGTLRTDPFRNAPLALTVVCDGLRAENAGGAGALRSAMSARSCLPPRQGRSRVAPGTAPQAPDAGSCQPRRETSRVRPAPPRRRLGGESRGQARPRSRESRQPPPPPQTPNVLVHRRSLHTSRRAQTKLPRPAQRLSGAAFCHPEKMRFETSGKRASTRRNVRIAHPWCSATALLLGAARAARPRAHTSRPSSHQRRPRAGRRRCRRAPQLILSDRLVTGGPERR
jgi:hypothetical protein